jgi:hypothetical protein
MPANNNIAAHLMSTTNSVARNRQTRTKRTIHLRLPVPTHSGCRNRYRVSHQGTRTASTPPVTTNQAALVITAADLRITIHPFGPPGRCRHRVAFRRGGRSRYAFRGSPTMAWIRGHGLSPTTAHVAMGVCLCSVNDPATGRLERSHVGTRWRPRTVSDHWSFPIGTSPTTEHDRS